MRQFDDLASQKLTELRTREQLVKPVMKTKVCRRSTALYLVALRWRDLKSFGMVQDLKVWQSPPLPLPTRPLPTPPPPHPIMKLFNVIVNKPSFAPLLLHYWV